jgi:hypothetical protein
MLLRQIIGLAAVASSVLVLSANCVGLSKPSNVATCAANGTCSDDIDDHSDAGNDGNADNDGKNADSGQITDLRPEAIAADALPDAWTIADAIDEGDTNAIGSDTRDTASEPSTLGDVTADQSLPGDTESEAVPEAMPESGSEGGPEPGPELPAEPGRDGGDTGAGNCINQIINNGYLYGTIPACSACKDNSTPLETKCKGMLDCLAPPNTKTDLTYCLNLVGGSQLVLQCVTALTTAACPSGF